MNTSRGANHYLSVLTEDDVLSIRAKYIKGVYGFKRLGREFKVDPTTITLIVTGQNWKHLL